jgi:hypothetical protein
VVGAGVDGGGVGGGRRGVGGVHGAFGAFGAFGAVLSLYIDCRSKKRGAVFAPFSRRFRALFPTSKKRGAKRGPLCCMPRAFFLNPLF